MSFRLYASDVGHSDTGERGCLKKAAEDFWQGKSSILRRSGLAGRSGPGSAIGPGVKNSEAVRHGFAVEAGGVRG
ncbi:hypothetical protein [Haloferula sp. A504]|uniref:hypothetical protein n=1 Tax=Haloferula sp. A504 TaxID=3373601 RepID=UPI0031C2CC0B|nr:hypothetical protein [Verrucomicrobiaceae bacterium E54]